MQLFKSQCLQEQGPAPRVLTYREAAFGLRYGGRAVARRTFCQSELVPGDEFALAARESQDRPAPRFDRAA